MAPSQEDILINVKLRMVEADAKFKKQLSSTMADLRVASKQELPKIQNAIEQGRMAHTNAMQTARVEAARLAANINKNKVAFSGYALSLMFFGQQIQKVFTGLAKTALSTFNDVMHSMEGNVTALDLLNNEWTYLKFVLGEALQPVLEWLVPIVSAIADWVSENQNLAASIIIWGAILGSVLALGGAAKLAFDGLQGLSVALTGTKIAAGALGALAWPVLLGVVAAALVLKSLKDTPEAMTAIRTSVGKLKEPLKTLWGSINDAVGALLGFAGGTDAVAWGFAWLVDFVVVSLRQVVNGIVLVINSLTTVVTSLRIVKTAWAAMWAAARGDKEKETTYWKTIDSDLIKLQSTLGKTSKAWEQMKTDTADYYDTLFTGPEAFKQAQLQLQGPNASFLGDVPASFMPAINASYAPKGGTMQSSVNQPNYQSASGQAIYMSGPVYIQADNAEKLFSEIKRYSS